MAVLLRNRFLASFFLTMAFAVGACGNPLSQPSSSANGSHLYFVRHAETEKNAGLSSSEAAFSPAGRRQIERLTKEVADLEVRFDHVFISPLARTRNTIAPFLADHKDLYAHAGVEVVSGLAECCWHDGDDREDDVKRTADRVKKLVQAGSRPKNILVVGHFYSGAIFLERLVGKNVHLKNAKLVAFTFGSH